jgi:hypothetical protein
MIISWLIWLSSFSLINTYEKAEQLANQLLSVKHESADTGVYCHLKTIYLFDSIINKPSDGYAYPIYKVRNIITYYESGKIATILKDISSIEHPVDPATGLSSLLVVYTTYKDDVLYFDQMQNEITEQQFYEIQEILCKKK